jgi:two-component system nitrogen regulation response regulator GlnG
MFEDAEALLSELDNQQPEVIITDVRMPGIDGLELMDRIRSECPQIPIIVMTAHSDLQSAVDAYQGGAFEYLPKPFDLNDVVTVTHRALERARLNRAETTKVSKVESQTQIIGEAPAMQEVFRAIGRLSKSKITALINGESGTGKELVAKALHQHSQRRDKPFIALNMAAIPADLIESELFGHEKGAFTGATTRREGRFEQADGGTLFLDEIGDMPPEAQTRLLRVLADGEFFRVGGRTSVKVDVRIIAATHQNLEELVRKHAFREDLFHRLNVIRIYLPKLAERSQDIPALARHFLARSAEELGMEAKVLTPETEQHISQLPWPGNVRELENFCRWLTVMAAGREVHLSDLPQEMRQQGRATTSTPIQDDWQALLREWAAKALVRGEHQILKSAVPAFERALIETALDYTGGKKRDAAELLGWGRNTLTRKLKELNLAGYRVGEEAEDPA